MAENSPTPEQDSKEAQKTDEARLSKRDKGILCRLITVVVVLWLIAGVIVGISFNSWPDRGQLATCSER